MPVQFGYLADGAGGLGRRAVEHQNFRAAVFQDFDLTVDGVVGNVESKVGNNPACGIAETLAQSFVQVAPELIVLPEHRDLAIGIGDLDIVCEYPALGPERRLPSHRPWKAPGMRPFLVAGSDEQLRDLFLVEVLAGGEIVRRAERAEHEEHFFLLDQLARPLHCVPRARAVVDGNEFDPAPVDTAALVDHVEIRGFPARPMAANAASGPV